MHPRRLTLSDSLDERLVKAKSSMIASTIPKSPIYREKKMLVWLPRFLRFAGYPYKIGEERNPRWK